MVMIDITQFSYSLSEKSGLSLFMKFKHEYNFSINAKDFKGSKFSKTETFNSL